MRLLALLTLCTLPLAPLSHALEAVAQAPWQASGNLATQVKIMGLQTRQDTLATTINQLQTTISQTIICAAAGQVWNGTSCVGGTCTGGTPTPKFPVCAGDEILTSFDGHTLNCVPLPTPTPTSTKCENPTTGSRVYDTPGTFSFKIPCFAKTIRVRVWGGGGGVTGMSNGSHPAGENGTASTLNGVLANGGSGSAAAIVAGAGDTLAWGGEAFGGTTNLKGGNYSVGASAGGAAPQGGAGGTASSIHGKAPGGGGFGAAGGGYAERTFSPDELIPETIVPGIVGKGGKGKTASITDRTGTHTNGGGNGAPGRVEITWE